MWLGAGCREGHRGVAQVAALGYLWAAGRGVSPCREPPVADATQVGECGDLGTLRTSLPAIITDHASAMRNPITDLRLIGALEGVSFLVLLFAAMPMKYLAGMPLGVRVVGMLHGVLFLLYLVAVARAARWRRWSPGRIVEALVASLYPFGTFLLDRKLREEAHPSPRGGNAPQADSSSAGEPRDRAI